MIKKLLLLCVIFGLSSADITLKQIDSKPPGRAKNFMIWQYLKQDITPKQADLAYAQVLGDISKIKRVYLKKSNNKKLQKEIECRAKKDLLSIEDRSCFKLAFSSYKTLHLDDNKRKELLKKLKSDSSKNIVKIQAEPYSEKAYKKYDSSTILSMFVNTTRNHRRENLNLNLSKKFINSVFSKSDSPWMNFAFIRTVIHDDKLDKLQISLLLLDGNNVDSRSNFLLALNNLNFSRVSPAIKHFKLAMKKAKKAEDVDKNRFWIYLVSGDKKYLNELALSSDINIYSLYAKEKLGKKVDNYFSSIDSVNENSKIDINDPFVWNDILEEIKATPKDELLQLANKYNQKNMIPVKAFIMEKALDFKMYSYIMPYNEYLQDVSNDEKALIYALMRQESRFIPAALSRSFALGLMQIMPFVVDDLSKRVDKPISTYNDMFKPSYSIRYSLKHLEWMKESLYHPLFIAYAYNGGMGYFRRHLESDTFKKGKYEPFLSMEMMLNSESREYGKKVLANYVMYKKILGEDVSIVDLLNSSTDLKKTDRFRLKD